MQFFIPVRGFVYEFADFFLLCNLVSLCVLLSLCVCNIMCLCVGPFMCLTLCWASKLPPAPPVQPNLCPRRYIHLADTYPPPRHLYIALRQGNARFRFVFAKYVHKFCKMRTNLLKVIQVFIGIVRKIRKLGKRLSSPVIRVKGKKALYIQQYPSQFSLFMEWSFYFFLELKQFFLTFWLYHHSPVFTIQSISLFSLFL